jgi:hypothetical protein
VLDLEGRLLSMNAGGMKLLEICDLGPIMALPDRFLERRRSRSSSQRSSNRATGVGALLDSSQRRAKTPKWFDVSVSPIHDTGQTEMLVAASRM